MPDALDRRQARGSRRPTGGGRPVVSDACRGSRFPSGGRHATIVSVIVHLIDGTYELFRHFYGLRRFTKGEDRPFGAVVGVLNGTLQMIEEGATHLGVATDHVIESFRNALFSGYKTGDGIEPALWAQFHPLEAALADMGVAVWPMIELEADDALASAAALAEKDPRVDKVSIWTPDKDLAQCVRGGRVVPVDRKSKVIRDADGVRAKFGVDPERIPDYLALVGDSADGYPGIAGIGPKGAAGLIGRHGRIEDFPAEVLGERRDLALLFKRLATLRTDAQIFASVEELEWRGPTERFEARCRALGDQKLLARAAKAAAA
jgi:5'-3' exonuclease